MSVTIALFVIAFYFVISSLINSMRRHKGYPPGPRLIPWIGNTYQLRSQSRKLGGQHIVFEKWAKEYNSPIIGIKLASENVIVVQSYEYVKEVHLNEAFEGRPDNFFLRLRTMGKRMGITCTDGSLWSDHRNFSVRHLRQVGYGRGPMEAYIKRECTELLLFIQKNQNTPIWPATFLAHSVINVLWTLTAGTEIDRNNEQLNTLLDLLRKRSKAFDLSGGVLNQMPWLRFIAPERTGYNMIYRLNKELHAFFQSTIDAHKKSYNDANSESDFIYAFIKEMKAQEGSDEHTFTDRQLIMTILDFFIAGSQTTSNTLDLALMMMLVRKDIQDRIIQEIDENLVAPDYATLTDRKLLPYTEAFLMEVQRYFHITPITGPRRALKTTTLGQYTVPVNTTVLIGMRSVLMDEAHWKDPKVFRPERFLNDGHQVRSDEYFIPFGQGKRRCLGDALARSCLFTFFVGIMRRFRVEPSVDGGDLPSTNLLPGITLSPKPYSAVFRDRTSPANGIQT